MLVCHCRSVTDRSVRAAVRNGAQTLSDVTRSCGAGGQCGGCQAALRKLIRSESASHTVQHTGVANDGGKAGGSDV